MLLRQKLCLRSYILFHLLRDKTIFFPAITDTKSLHNPPEGVRKNGSRLYQRLTVFPSNTVKRTGPEIKPSPSIPRSKQSGTLPLSEYPAEQVSFFVFYLDSQANARQNWSGSHARGRERLKNVYELHLFYRLLPMAYTVVNSWRRLAAVSTSFIFFSFIFSGVRTYRLSQKICQARVLLQ